MSIVTELRNLISKNEEAMQVGTFGTAGVGKTTFWAAFDLLCTDLSNEHEIAKRELGCIYRYMPWEFGLFSGKYNGVKIAQSRLRQGLFPEKTPNLNVAYELQTYHRFEYRLTAKNIVLPVVETAGEVLARLLGKLGSSQYSPLNPKQGLNTAEAQLIASKLLDSDGAILCCPVTQAITQGGTLGDGVQIEVTDPSLPDDPDVNMNRLIQCIAQYKMVTPGSRRLRAVYIVLTKADAIKERLKSAGFDIESEDGMMRFMKRFYPNTLSALGWFKNLKFRIFPFWVYAEKDQNLTPVMHSDGYHVMVDPSKDRPYYSVDHLLKLLRALREDFGS